jgi:hypothetical protein
MNVQFRLRNRQILPRPGERIRDCEKRRVATRGCGDISGGELSRLWLRIIIACQLGTLADAERLRQEANELVSIFTAGMKRLRPVVPRTTTEK